MGLVLMGGKEGMGEGIEVENVWQECSIGLDTIGLDEDLMADTKTTQTKVEKFLIQEFFLDQIIVGLLDLDKLCVDGMDFVHK